MVLAILRPECFFFKRLKPISAARSRRRPFGPSREIQCAVTAKKDDMFELDQLSAVKLIRPQAF